MISLYLSSAPNLIRNSSTTLGSIGLSSNFAPMPAPDYKITKAALNMLTVQYAQAFAKDGFTFFTISPGVRSIPIPFSGNLPRVEMLCLTSYSGSKPTWAVLVPIYLCKQVPTLF